MPLLLVEFRVEKKPSAALQIFNGKCAIEPGIHKLFETKGLPQQQHLHVMTITLLKKKMSNGKMHSTESVVSSKKRTTLFNIILIICSTN